MNSTLFESDTSLEPTVGLVGMHQPQVRLLAVQPLPRPLFLELLRYIAHRASQG